MEKTGVTQKVSTENLTTSSFGMFLKTCIYITMLRQSTTRWPDPDRRIGESFDPNIDYRPSWKHYVKRFLYPTFISLYSACQKFRSGLPREFSSNNIIIGPRGSEFDYLLFRLGASKIRGSKVLLQGVGNAKEFVFWQPYNPSSITAVDLYPSWGTDVLKYDFEYVFIKADLEALPFDDGMFDGIASINVFEHVRNLDQVLQETYRVLSSGGWFLASFGPLYHTIGGDHLSRIRGGIEHGYNHILLDRETYQDFVDHMMIDGIDRTDEIPHYIESDLFSRLCYQAYSKAFHQYFEVKYFKAHVNWEALIYRHSFPEKWSQLLGKGYSERDLLISTIVVIGTKP